MEEVNEIFFVFFLSLQEVVEYMCKFVANFSLCMGFDIVEKYVFILNNHRIKFKLKYFQ